MNTEPDCLVVGETVAVSSTPVRERRAAGPGGREQGRDQPVHRITEARAPHSAEMSRRMRAYAVSMGIRTLCVAGFVIVFPHWSAWLFVPGAALLPYVAVLLANAGREAKPTALPRIGRRPTHPALPAAAAASHDTAAATGAEAGPAGARSASGATAAEGPGPR